MRGGCRLPLLPSLLGALVGVLALAGCLSADPPPETAAEERDQPLLAPHRESDSGPQTLRWAVTPPRDIIPPLVVDGSGAVVADALFDGLTRVVDGRVRPAAADNWFSSRDGSVWTFSLREGATFHDGTPVTAEDFVRSWEEGVRLGRTAPHLEDVVGHEALRAGDADAMEGLRARGPRTLQVFLDRPRADFEAVVAHPALAPLPEAWETDEDAYRAQPIGNGPFEITEELGQGAFVRARRSESWANGRPPAIGELLFRFVEPSSGFVAFQQGRVDIAEVPGGGLDAAIERFGEADGATRTTGVFRETAAEVYLLGMNTQEPPFDDPTIRRALSFALDRERIVERIPDANALPARGLAPPVVDGGRVSACTTCWHVPGAAQRTFSDHGVDQLELWVNEGGGHEDVAEEIAESLAEVGVTLHVRSVPFDDFVEAVESGEAQLFRYGWAADHPTLDDFVVPLLHSSDPGLATGNPGRYANAEVDQLLEEARATTDADARIELLQSAETLAVGRQQAVIPVLFTRHRIVVGERVEGFRVGPTGLVDVTSVRLDDPED